MHTEIATTETLGGPERYLTFVTTDKPIYRGGEKIYVRGVVLNAANHKPLASRDSTNQATIQIKGPKGDIVASGTAQPEDGVWGFAWEIPKGQTGGEYIINVTYPWSGHAPAERKFDIRAYRAPRLKSQITFLRDGYGPGDKVNATLDVKRAEGGVPEGAKVTVNARVDGIQINGGTAKVDAKGLCAVSFDLPYEIPRGEGTLSLIIEDGGVVETASKTIPILLQTVDLKIYPEGGDLVAGFKNRVYIEAHQPNGKPADLAGKLMKTDQGHFLSAISENDPIRMSTEGMDSESIGDFHTDHEGRGRFEFIPEADKAYYLTIVQPAGIKSVYHLPSIRTQGAVIHAVEDIFPKGKRVMLEVGCREEGFRVTLFKREVQVGYFDSQQEEPDHAVLHPVSFHVPPEIDGVLTATVWDKEGTPIAERLIFRESAKSLNISIDADKESYIPGGNVRLTVRTTDEKGNPASAVVGVTVTDDSVLEMVEKRDQAPRLPVMVYLEPEVQDLADAHVYLDSSNPKAAKAMDLLLGTQGWRRFALMELAKFVAEHGDQARRAVALKIQARAEAMRGWGAPAGGMPPPAPGMAPMGLPQRSALMGQLVRQRSQSAPAQSPTSQTQGAAFDIAIEEKSLGVADQAARNEEPLIGDFAEPPAPQLQPPPPAMAPPPAAAPSRYRVLPSVAMEALQQAIADQQPQLAASFKRAAAFEVAHQAPQSSLVLVREFAHQVRQDREPSDRVDFTETLYWNAGVKTDPKTGQFTIVFGLNDSVTTFRAFGDAFSENGAVGATTKEIESVQPFYAEAKLPLEVTSGDRILLPINLVNATAGDLGGADLKIDLKGDFKLLDLERASSSLQAGSRVRWLQPIDVGRVNGPKAFVLTAKAGAYEDNVTRHLSVQPMGFPIETAFGGMLEPGSSAIHSLVVPDGLVPGSMISHTAVYATPLANMTEALERLIRDPSGCFEQTSSTSYPLTMAQQYFLSHTGVDPKLVETSRQKLDKGYKQLVGFWCPDRGYEWFGQDPGHEALTAFGLLHFSDMAEVREVDQNMISTTRAWLLKQKDGQGGFSRKRRALHSWIEDKDCSNAYICWALLESGESADNLQPELASLQTAADSSQNSYVVALAANAMYLSGNKSEAKKLMDRLAAKQKADGSVDGITSSIVGSGGEALQIEGTALTALAWMRDAAYGANVEKTMKFLADSCKGGRYGSTQSTVLALRAIVTYDKLRAHPRAPGKVRVYIDGQGIGDWVAFDQHNQGPIELPDISESLTAGEHTLELRMQDGCPMPYSLAVRYNAVTPASSAECKLELEVKLAQEKVTEGASTEANVTVTNKTAEAIPTPVAIIGLPGGLEPRHDQLKELVKKATIDAYEVRGREVVLYWRSLPGAAKQEVPLSLIAAVPGSYTGPASRAYLYYTDEHKQWVDGAHIEIAAK